MQSTKLSHLARDIFERALADCDIDRAMALKVKSTGTQARSVAFGEHILDLNSFQHFRIIALGKAAAAMLEALLPRLDLPAQCDLAGILISPQCPRQLPERFQFFPGGHPLPNAASFAGARAVLAMLGELRTARSAQRDTLCIFLISGGASAMVEAPLDPSISLEDTIQFHRALVHCGASITEINCVRKHFSAVKGGRLAAACADGECISLLISDVPEGQLETIASGPTIPDTSTIAECRSILSNYNLMDQLPAPVQRFFASAFLPETPKPGSIISRTVTLLDSNDLTKAARRRALELGFDVVIDNTCDDWDYRSASDYLLGQLRTLRHVHPRVCLISVGEVTVSLPATESAENEKSAEPRIGGRNQHLVLYTATLLHDTDVPIAVLSAGSDGIDGNSTAAGAVIDQNALRSVPVEAPAKIDALFPDAKASLDQYCSFPFLQRISATIITGPTGSNLRDLRIYLAEQPAGAPTKCDTENKGRAQR